MFIIEKYGKELVAYFLDVEAKVKMNREENKICFCILGNLFETELNYEKQNELFLKYFTLFLKDLYYNYIREGIIIFEFQEKFEELVKHHFGG